MEDPISDFGNSSNSTTDKIIEICPTIWAAAEQFALQRIGLSESLYRQRGEANTAKMIEDIITGVIAEFGAYAYLRARGYNPSKPDLSIHQTGQKTYGADLTFSLSNPDLDVPKQQYIHVKSQSKASAEKYGISWLFQGEDKALSLPSETGYAIFCTVDGLAVTIKAVVYLIDILEQDLAKAPKVFKYGFTKKAIYFSDLLNSKIDLKRF